MANRGNGQYEFVDESSRIMYTTAHAALTLLELWDFVKKDPGPLGFMYSGAPEVDQIYAKVEELGYSGHSGASFGCTLRTMQYIAKNGYDNFRNEYTARQQT
uniref:Uncharacterized protein n=1 Tax=viral metagenome TaxID=1070528 RepID=A0A6C0B0K2_9ZZZZ